MAKTPPNLLAIDERKHIEDEVRAEMVAKEMEERATERDKALLALGVTAVFTLGIALPVLGLIVGVSLRLFWWAAGYGW